MLRDIEHQRVDLVDAQRVAGFAISGQGAAAQSKDADPPRTAEVGTHGPADPRIFAEVGDGLAAVVRQERLLAMVDDAVDENADRPFIDLRISGIVHPELPVEIPFDYLIAGHEGM